jgi:hypothetical protein
MSGFAALLYCRERRTPVPLQMNNKKYRYNHIEIPTTQKLKNETYLAKLEKYLCP